MNRWGRAAALAVAVTATVVPAALSQSRGSYGGSESGLDLMDVDLLFVGAHPDDDMGILATFARYLRDEGFKGTVITLTGGEGGGNATGRETGRALGLIREEEERRSLLLAGVNHPHFLGLQDFYFTLSAEEAAARWGDRFVCDVVRHVRLERPEVIVTMWPGPGTHGQHQMAARAATLAFERAGDPAFCPEQVTSEFLRPFTPLKLYYFPNDRKGEGVVSVPVTDFSRSAAMPYADLKSLAVRNYRSQGYERGAPLPAQRTEPESFLLVRSRVPVLEAERHLLEGALLPAGPSPPGIRLEVQADPREAVVGSEITLRVRLVNETAEALQKVALELKGPEGWELRPTSPTGTATVERGDSLAASFRAKAIGTGQVARFEAAYSAFGRAGRIAGSNPTRVLVAGPLRAGWKPLFDVLGYREFARSTGTEWVIPSLKTRVPAVVGRRSRVPVELHNRGDREMKGELRAEPQAGVKSVAPVAFTLPAGGRADSALALEVDASVLPEGRQSARVPLTLAVAGNATGGATGTETATEARDEADLYVLPGLVAPRMARPPLIDGDLSDMAGLARGAITPKDRWLRTEPSGPADLSGEFFVGYDLRALYVGVRVHDEAVVCNISPLDIKAQLRSDSVGVTVDPSGKSQDTSTTLQAAAFPCTTNGFGARGFRDADARPGVMEETAPGMQVVSRKTDSGYEIEFALPFAAMPVTPKAGDEIGFNVVLYDGDQKDARPGANINESGLAWASFEWGGKQALPYLWGRVTLGR